MAKYTFTKLAVEDLNNIWNYICDTWSEKQADQYYNEIITKCSEIVNNPEMGRTYFHFADFTRGVRIRKHIIFYRQTDQETIEIARILHQRMDLKNKFVK